MYVQQLFDRLDKILSWFSGSPWRGKGVARNKLPFSNSISPLPEKGRGEMGTCEKLQPQRRTRLLQWKQFIFILDFIFSLWENETFVKDEEPKKYCLSARLQKHQLCIHIWFLFGWMQPLVRARLLEPCLVSFTYQSRDNIEAFSETATESQRWKKTFNDAVTRCMSSKVSTGNVSINDYCFSFMLGVRLFLSPQCVPTDRLGYVFKTHPFPSPKYSRCIKEQNNSLRAFPFMYSWRWAEPSPPTHFYYLTHVPAGSCM